MLSWFILAPLAGVILLNLPLADALRKRAFVFAVLLAAAQAVLLCIPQVSLTAGGGVENFLQLDLQLTRLGMVMLLSIGLSLFAAALVGMATVSAADEPRRPARFASLLLLAMAAMNGAVLVKDLFSLYVFIEITSVASFVMIAFHREAKALEGAFKYLLMSAIATVLMLTAVGLLLMVAGSTGFAGVAEALKKGPNVVIARIAIGAFLCGLFIKGGLVPFHGWVLGAYSAAPSAASVMLAGIGTKVSGVYALVRLTQEVFPHSQGLTDVLMLVGAISIAVGALAALGQKDMKRMLAYSSISQVGYIILALGCAVMAIDPTGPKAPVLQAAAELALAAAVFHLFNHCVFKSLLFVNSAALDQQLGTTDMNRMGGLSSRMPITGVTCLIGSLSTAGVPPFSGFFSKALIVVALWKAGFTFYAGFAVALSLFTLAYFLVLQRKVFFGKLSDTLSTVREAGWELTLPAVILAAVTSGMGLMIPLLLNTFLLPIAFSTVL
jgi:multicomponent Na+:H+ antiporter subunit D